VTDRLLEIHSSSWAVSSLTVFELHRGIASGIRQSLAERTEDFIAAAQILAFGKADATRGAEIESHLVTMGKPVGLADVLIAAHAVSNNLILVTNNTKHFENVPGLKLENWL
jgi:tRNA(fMet)-specific endonuclease VapC